jgi:hypothetical protein
VVSTTTRRRSARRRWVHLGLIGSAVVSLAWEPVLTIHIFVGLLLVALVVTHLAQRRRVSTALLAGLVRRRSIPSRSTRTAAADLLLLAVTTLMFASGLWDWLAGHPTRIRWHALSGVALAALVLIHTVRRRRRLLDSRVR